jgi:DNA-binding transcriptional regulator YhcF (GntR family)
LKNGYIKLYRGIFDEFWQDEKFSKSSAWIDLLLSANYEDKTMMIDNKVVVVKRGSFITSIQKLAARWKWSVNTTKRFLNTLEVNKMISRLSTCRYTLIDIVNYAKYQGQSESVAHSLTDTLTDSLTDSLTVNKEYKESKKEKVISKDITQKKSESSVDAIREVVELFKATCPSYPGVRTLSSNRQRAVKARLNTYSLDDFKQVFTKAEESDFLKGKNNRNWMASFDWLMNDSNFAKVLEGNYDNRDKPEVKKPSRDWSKF